ncbi:unnamed protein product [Porites evermanni]|uniref:Uncharacterized protein n=1 Tax=Porites evermanni TaxID=104178 RepID=A0ABN8M5J2_9CNID|nr:unnamed protein product [Porites evermanni]
MSSVWDFCTHFSDVISWWQCEMLAVFSVFPFCLIKLGNIHVKYTYAKQRHVVRIRDLISFEPHLDGRVGIL